jgi:hypothetical protein
MDLLTILGNALADNDFLDQLFKDPFKTVERYGFHLTNVEHDALKEITQGTRARDNQEYMGKIYTCPHRPCAFALAKPRPEETAATTERSKVA